MEKDQFDGLIALKIVAEEKSFTAAADRLNVSPPAISKMISLLEKKMGVTLLTRTTRSVSLSEAGEIFLSQAGPAMEQIINAQNNAKNFGETARGTLKLNMPGVLFPYYLKEYVASFLERYPEVTIDLFADDQASDIFERGFDAGVRTDDIIAKDLTAFKLFEPVRFLAVASPDYLKKMGTPKHPKDLLNHNCIRHRFGTGNNIYEKWEFEEDSKEFVVNIHGNLILNTSETIRHAALTGMGIVYTEYGNVAQDIKEKKLKVILSEYETEPMAFYLYYPDRNQVSPTLRAFIEHVKAQR